MKPFAIWTAFSQTKSEDAAQKKRALNAILISLLVHIVFIIAAVSLTILIIAPKPKMMFEGKKSPSLPPRKLEHSIRVKQMKKQTRKPQILQRLVTEAPSKVALPEMPEMKTPDIKNMRDTPLMNSRAGSIGSLGGGGGGAGRGLTGGMGYSDAKFFGENVRTRAITICMDISPSMVAKGVTQDVLTEATKMLENMNVGTKFNIVVFVDGSTPFTPQMVYATQENKAKAIEWLKQPFDGRRQGQLHGHSGSTPHMAIEMAVEMGADTVFVLTDDPPYLKVGNVQTGVEIPTHMEDIATYVKSIESTTGKSVRFYPILYKPFENERGKQAIEYYKRLARSSGGKSRVIKRD
ncbi:MAG: hypothetical protein PHO14_00230 [Kiritimatiellae bacterium]|jgi:hypothetical protein|nr:hypothetical protein [Kiritimatiellia bacterium]MDD4340640.1 hypothetical protein [Kiritimatiellia bacterium]MDY0150144.1 hypothetical protein [Kiritimatiellia bacterium]